jgi:hypothetical protein
MQNCTIDDALEMMKNDTSIAFYEYNDGLHVNNKYLIKLDTDNSLASLICFMKMILVSLPHTKLEEFEYYSRFNSETNFEDLTGIPDTLRVLNLANYKGVSNQMIETLMKNDVACNHQFYEYYKDDDMIMQDDTYTYQLISNKWTAIVATI